MSGSSLTPLQERILRALSALTPPWTLTGGGALAGVHLGHRGTRDLDLFWRNRDQLGELARDAMAALQADGLEAQVLRTTPAFAQLRAAAGDEACVIDLVAEPFAPIEPPQIAIVSGVSIAVDSAHEILVNKLATVLNRSELRDLVDLKALLDAGGDLTRAVSQAPEKDAGFSALTLAWVLEEFDLRAAARALDWTESQAEDLVVFQKQLIQRLTSEAAPE